MWGHLSHFPCSFGLQQWYQEESQRTSYFLFCGAGRRRPSGVPGQGEEEVLLKKLRQGKQPLTSTIVNSNDIQIKMYGRHFWDLDVGPGDWERPPDELQNCTSHPFWMGSVWAFVVSYASLVAHLVKNLPTMQEVQAGWEDTLEKEMATN